MKTNRLFVGALGAVLAAHLVVIGACWAGRDGAPSAERRPDPAPSTAHQAVKAPSAAASAP